MLHLRTDYNAIQPWPTKRPHHGIVMEEAVHTDDLDLPEVPVKYLDLGDDSLEMLGDAIDPIIPDDEPVFLLRAKDKNAAAVVRVWASYLELDGGPSRLVDVVRGWADRMEAYADANYQGGKIPDTPVEFLP